MRHTQRQECGGETSVTTSVTSRKGRRKTREECHTSIPLQCAERLPLVYLCITICHPGTDEEVIEDFLVQKFENVSNKKAYNNKMTHQFYSSFTVTMRQKYKARTLHKFRCFS